MELPPELTSLSARAIGWTVIREFLAVRGYKIEGNQQSQERMRDLYVSVSAWSHFVHALSRKTVLNMEIAEETSGRYRKCHAAR